MANFLNQILSDVQQSMDRHALETEYIVNPWTPEADRMIVLAITSLLPLEDWYAIIRDLNVTRQEVYKETIGLSNLQRIRYLMDVSGRVQKGNDQSPTMYIHVLVDCTPDNVPDYWHIFFELTDTVAHSSGFELRSNKHANRTWDENKAALAAWLKDALVKDQKARRDIAERQAALDDVRDALVEPWPHGTVTLYEMILKVGDHTDTLYWFEHPAWWRVQEKENRPSEVFSTYRRAPTRVSLPEAGIVYQQEIQDAGDLPDELCTQVWHDDKIIGYNAKPWVHEHLAVVREYNASQEAALEHARYQTGLK